MSFKSKSMIDQIQGELSAHLTEIRNLFKPGAVVMLVVNFDDKTDKSTLMCTVPERTQGCIDVAQALYMNPAQIIPGKKTVADMRKEAGQ